MYDQFALTQMEEKITKYYYVFIQQHVDIFPEPGPFIFL